MIAGPITPERLAALPDSALISVRVRIHEKRWVEQIELRVGLLRRLLGYFVDLTRPLVFKAGKLRAYKRTDPQGGVQNNRLSQPLADMIEKHEPNPALVKSAPRGPDARLSILRPQRTPENLAHPRIQARAIVAAEVARINAVPRDQRRIGPLLSAFINSPNEKSK